MARMQFKINKRDLRTLQMKIDNVVNTTTEESYEFFKKKTPIKSGNARRKTSYREQPNSATINAKYDYAQRLDDGWSKQAPKGMSEPTVNFLRRKLGRGFRRI